MLDGQVKPGVLYLPSINPTLQLSALIRQFGCWPEKDGQYVVLIKENSNKPDQLVINTPLELDQSNTLNLMINPASNAVSLNAVKRIY